MGGFLLRGGRFGQLVGIGFGLIEMLSSKKDAIIWAFMIQFLLLCSL